MKRVKIDGVLMQPKQKVNSRKASMMKVNDDRVANEQGRRTKMLFPLGSISCAYVYPSMVGRSMLA